MDTIENKESSTQTLPQGFTFKPEDFQLSERKIGGVIHMQLTYKPSNIVLSAKGFSRGYLRRMLSEGLHEEMKSRGLLAAKIEFK